MKKLIPLILFFATYTASAQVIPSDCTISPELREAYEHDVKNIVYRRMVDIGHADTAAIKISEQWMDTVYEALAAVSNLYGIIPEADSVFNKYCVHDEANWPKLEQSILLQIDTNEAWTNAWRSLITPTGNALVDQLTSDYSMQVNSYYDWGPVQYIELSYPSIVNTFALIDSFELITGIFQGEPNWLLGGAGKIDYFKTPTYRVFNFVFEWADCFDGCDNQKTWHFKVSNDCSVEYLGLTHTGVWGVMPLPAPINCNPSTAIDNPMLDEEPQTIIYPNPTAAHFYIVPGFDQPYTYSIYSLNGQVMHPELSSSDLTSGTLEVATSELSPGIYLLELRTGDNTFERYTLHIAR